MNEQQHMLTEMVDGLFAGLGPSATIEKNWPQIEELGLTTLLLPEADGGFGGSWQDALIVFRLSGYHALSLPVPEAVIAARLASGCGLQGRGTIASRSDGRLEGGRFTGTVHGAVQSAGAAYIVAPATDGGSIVLSTEGAQRKPANNLAGEGRDVWAFDGASAFAVTEDVFELGAFARVAQIAGGLDAALGMSVSYANDRKQFGRPLAKFQAVQQSLATFAGEAAAANCAAMGLAQALDRGNADYEVAAAKLRANRAVGVGTSSAHQAHGAIGFTKEYDLHPITRRLWSARSEFGGDSHWATVLGGKVITAGAHRFWADLTALTD
ncbi:acyl-CoA dehydrogenase family protein [Novosphingobium taihuense]|uniref:Acyl-CoA dehydrogenase n=1 Tax=Novosphingobium taihuense TaxID=260085 RepID=A0A7W7AEU8_9SPHN|nr:acyl-CoA dehydrogenase family protein [Novosphingobium taihuense]MBB4615014.1 acyl-CoA dehydrogenase [Novosphingobium taihuense]TWH84545.1 acyl-CoA dehydrogenase [Novosphingobium taihuense]